MLQAFTVINYRMFLFVLMMGCGLSFIRMTAEGTRHEAKEREREREERERERGEREREDRGGGGPGRGDKGGERVTEVWCAIYTVLCFLIQMISCSDTKLLYMHILNDEIFMRFNTTDPFHAQKHRSKHGATRNDFTCAFCRSCSATVKIHLHEEAFDL